MADFAELIDRYVEFKKALGFDFAGAAQILRRWFREAGDRGLSPDAVARWATGGPGHPRSYQIHRYEEVRRFSSFASAIDPSIRPLPPGILGSERDRVVPYIYSDEDVELLMRCALSVNSPDGLRGRGLAFLIGLMRSCGLRVGEAVGLDDADFEPASHELSIRHSKFGSSRTIPVSDSTARAIGEYRDRRGGPEGALIRTTGGKRLSRDSAEDMFGEVRWTLLGRGESFAARKPRLHDLRHTFATATLIRWQREGEDVNALMPHLSAYLGHRKLSDTYWYLTGVPELLGVAASAFRSAGLSGGGRDASE